MTLMTGVREAPTRVGAAVKVGQGRASVEDTRGHGASQYVWARSFAS